MRISSRFSSPWLVVMGGGAVVEIGELIGSTMSGVSVGDYANNALDLVDGALGARDAAARSRYFAELERRYAGDKAMLDFIAGLKKSLR